jgi:hypothetical protein
MTTYSLITPFPTFPQGGRNKTTIPLSGIRKGVQSETGDSQQILIQLPVSATQPKNDIYDKYKNCNDNEYTKVHSCFEYTGYYTA